MENYDVAVVGAGPGGSSVAERCAERGLDVVLYEKRQEIGTPVRCAEGLSGGSVDVLDKDIPDKCIAQKIRGAEVFSPNGDSVDVDYGKGYILERRMYDRWLAEEAARAGAKVRSKCTVDDIIMEDDFVRGVRGNFDGEKFETNSKIVVDAGGVESQLARRAGIKNSIDPVNIDSGFQYEMVDIDLQDPYKIELYFGNKIAPRGYIWIFPKGRDKANVGIGIGGGKQEKTAKEYLDDWIENKPSIKRGSITSVISGGIPVGGFLDNMVKDGLITIGDAAHQVNPIHGGGLKEATIAGQMAGNIINEAFEEDKFTEDFLSKYNKRWWDRRGKKLKKVEKIREVVEKLSDDDLNLLAENLNGEELISFTRGNKLGNLAKILMKKPRLMGLAKHLI